MKRGKLAVIVGPSGVGQDTVLKLFIKNHPEWRLDPSLTTRKPRPGEIDGVDMKFVTNQEFEQLQKTGKLLEAFKVTDYWYGTLREPVEQRLAEGKNVFLRKDPQGALKIKEQIPDATLIFINAESWEALEQRMRNRHTESEAELERRLQTNRQKLTYIDQFENVVINPTGHPEQAVAELEKILKS